MERKLKKKIKGDMDKLKEIDKELDKGDVKLETKKGCFLISVNNKDIMVMR